MPDRFALYMAMLFSVAGAVSKVPSIHEPHLAEARAGWGERGEVHRCIVSFYVL